MPVKRRNNESGFTMISVMLGITLVVALSMVGVAAVSGDLGLAQNDLNHRRAFEAAKAGINDYVYHLHKDNNYWTSCTGAPTPNALNQVGSTTKRRAVPGHTGGTYAIELLPAAGQTQYSECSAANAASSMLEPTGLLKGTFRIRSNGFSGSSKVSIIATFKPATFLDYVYFTQLETSDPVTYGYAPLSEGLAGVNSQCNKTIKQGRYLQAIPSTSEWCDTISFVEGDSIKGPMHTNDAFVICNKPTLGRGSADPIEVSGPPVGWFSTKDIPHSGSSCTGSEQNFKGTFTANSPAITPPPTNSELKTIAGLRFSGQVRICLSGTTMSVGAGKSCTENVQYSGPIPGNGVVYVETSTCGTVYSPFTATYPATSGCGNAYIHGNYSGQLTVATDNDIIIDGNLVHSGEGVLGLVANNFVRIYHPFTEIETSAQTGHNKCNSGSNGATSLTPVQIDAAILAINHSFIVDHYDCGAALGTLTVNGAIAQKYRGAVGTSGGSGYIKNYNYDDRLRFLEPPSFIEPKQSDWVIGRETIE
jgi:type II secretory pathway pseudopilin PulG